MTVRPHEIASLAEAIGVLRALDAPADAKLRAFFRAHPEMGPHDRAFVAEGAFAFLRRMRSLIALAGTSEPRKLALAVVVREFGRSVRELAPAIRGAEVEWLSTFKARLAEPLAPAVAADLPDWLFAKLTAVYDDQGRDALVAAWNEPAPMDLRVNPGKTTRDAAIAALTADGIVATPTPYAPLGIRVTGRPMLAKHPWFLDGRIEVQDEGSQIVAHLVAPRRSDLVVDFCAGAGGKTLLLGALMRSQGRLYAFDIAERRLAKLKPRLARSGLSNVHPQWIASELDTKVKRLAGKADRVLVDAPCTGFGTLRRNPDLKWRQHEDDLAELVARQTAILDAAATLVKPGGRLVYATCSVLPEENEGIVGAFVARNPAFHVVDASRELLRVGIPLDTGATLSLLPHLHGCDGFFAAILERSSTTRTPPLD